MSEVSRRRHKSASTTATNKLSTKELLINTGEHLFGQHGLNGISLREIAAAAGQGNCNVVQYHFKDKSGLVSAILEDRVFQLETLRRDMLEQLLQQPGQSVDGRATSDEALAGNSQLARQLLTILWQPSLTIRSADGSYPFCRFLLQYMIQPHIAEHPLARLYTTYGEQNLSSLIKATRLLRDLHTHLPEPVLNQRMSALSMMFLATVVEFDNRQQLGSDNPVTDFDIKPIIDMGVAALSTVPTQ